MNDRIASFLASKRAAVLTAVLILTLLGGLSTLRTPIAQVWADEGTFLAMTASLALDGDLRFTEADLARLDVSDPGRASLILERTELGISYSKPIVLPLAAAPFWALFGDFGLVVLNALALIFSLWLTQRYLQRLPAGEDDARASWVIVTFALAAVVVPYIFWRMADLLQLTLCLTGLVLCFAQRRSPGPHSPPEVRPGWRDRLLDHRLSPWIGVALIAVTTNMRLSNGALILIPVAAELFSGRLRTAIAKGLVGAGTVAAMVGLTFFLTGAVDPYRAERTSFLPSTGYPAGSDAATALERFDAKPATHVNIMAQGSQIAYAAGYFWIGRHSGLLFYFPAAVVFLWIALRRRPDAVTWACLLGAGVVLAFFIAWKPVNYFGGATFIGNRYFLSIYPAFLAAMAVRPSRRALAVAWLMAAAVYGSVTWSILAHHEIDRGSQSHTRGGWLANLPYESTSRSMDGTRDRYWTGQFVRFLDPLAHVTKDTFDLEAGRSFSQVMVAQWQEPGPLRYLVESEADQATLVVRDWRRRERRYSVGKALDPEHGLVGIDVETADPWRHHGYWFETKPYWSRVLGFRLEAPAGTKARIHHLGELELAAAAFAYQPLDMQLPNRAQSGGRDTVTLSVRNISGAYWQPDDVTAVTGRYRVLRGEEVLAESGRMTLTDRIGPGETLTLPLDVQWPEATGVVTFEADLVLEHIDWFKNRLGRPVLQGEVELIPAADPD